MAICLSCNLRTRLANDVNKFGPSREEVKFRMRFSIGGLALLLGAIAYRGIPSGPAMFEVIVIAGTFFGGTLIWSISKLRSIDQSAPSEKERD